MCAGGIHARCLTSEFECLTGQLSLPAKASTHWTRTRQLLRIDITKVEQRSHPRSGLLGDIMDEAVPAAGHSEHDEDSTVQPQEQPASPITGEDTGQASSGFGCARTPAALLHCGHCCTALVPHPALAGA